MAGSTRWWVGEVPREAGIHFPALAEASRAVVDPFSSEHVYEVPCADKGGSQLVGWTPKISVIPSNS